MAKLKHIVLSVEDVHKTAAFYKATFDLQETDREEHRVWLSDGVVSLAIIDANRHRNATGGPLGLNHFGFVVEDMDDTAARVVSHGGSYHELVSGKDRGAARQFKFRDPNGVYVEVVNAEHARGKWFVPS